MNRVYLFAALSALTMCFRCDGGEKMNKSGYAYGVQKYGHETVDTIQTNGSIILDGTNVLDAVSVNGSLNAEKSSIGSLVVNGQATLKNCLVNNTTIINGSLNADNTRFQKELSIASQRITLKACYVGSLVVREVNGDDRTQIIDLRSGTKIAGPIIVESGNGEVWISSNSEILDQVSGAKVLRGA